MIRDEHIEAAITQGVLTADQAARLREGMAENLRRRGGPASLLVVEGRWKGKRLSEIANATAVDPISAAIATDNAPSTTHTASACRPPTANGRR